MLSIFRNRKVNGSGLKEFVEFVARQLVDVPDAVTVSEVGGEHTTVIELRVDQADMGKVIGRKGETARSLRILLAAVSRRQGKRVVLEILE